VELDEDDEDEDEDEVESDLLEPLSLDVLELLSDEDLAEPEDDFEDSERESVR
jgi:hypothetical protein